jgi:hypothetical protein
MGDDRHLEILAQLAHSDHATADGPVAWDRCGHALCRTSQSVLGDERRPAMPDVRFGPPANIGEPVPAETVVVGEDVVARLVTELSDARADLARASARAAALVEAGNDLAYWLQEWVDAHPEPSPCYSIGALNRWRALAGASGQRAGAEGEG